MKNNIRNYLHYCPDIAEEVFIDPTAVIIGHVSIGAESSIWPGVVIRGDVDKISIGYMSNIQDLSVLHGGHIEQPVYKGFPVVVGDYVTIGHKVMLHGCIIHDESLIGMSSTVLDGAVIEKHVLVGAGSLVPPGAVLESGYLYLGSPVKKIRALTQQEIAFFKQSALNYQKYAQNHRLGSVS